MLRRGGLWDLVNPPTGGATSGTPGSPAQPPQSLHPQEGEDLKGVPPSVPFQGCAADAPDLGPAQMAPGAPVRPVVLQCPRCRRAVPMAIGPLFEELRARVLRKIERIAPLALELGWGIQDLFLLRQRVDLSGLAGFLDPTDEIVRVGTESIEIRTASGAVQNFYRRDHPHPWISKIEGPDA